MAHPYCKLDALPQMACDCEDRHIRKYTPNNLMLCSKTEGYRNYMSLCRIENEVILIILNA
jgi:hypothetical protein